MDSLSLTLSLFLLFSPLDSMQENLFYSATGNKYTIQDELAFKKEVELHFEEAVIKASELGISVPSSYFSDKEQEFNYFLENDDEGTELDSSIENPEYGEQGESSPLVNSNSNLFNGTASVGEIVYKSRDFMLRLLKSGSERFSLKSEGSSRQTINVNDDIFIRYINDDKYNVVEKDVFKNGLTISDISLLSRTFYDYENGILIRSSYEDFQNKKVVVTDFTGNKNPVTVKTYIMGEINNSNSLYIDRISFSDFQIDNVISRKFDDEDRITSEETVKYLYDEKDVKTKVLKNVFVYTGKSSNPDYKYFEDNVLCLEVNYSGELSYVEHIYFSGKYEVKNRYSDGKKVSEVYYENGKEIRRRSF